MTVKYGCRRFSFISAFMRVELNYFTDIINIQLQCNLLWGIKKIQNKVSICYALLYIHMIGILKMCQFETCHTDF